MHPEPDKEIEAIMAVNTALKDLDPTAQLRVIEYVQKKLGLSTHPSTGRASDDRRSDEYENGSRIEPSVTQNENQKEASDEFAGISPVAQRWMQRNGLTGKQLSSIFSLGDDEIDLVAKKVPGGSTRARMRNVFLLKGLAAYLGSGAARFPHDKAKEACVHYDAFDGTNFSKHLKSLAPEVSGTKESGYTLTPRGLSSAVEPVKDMLGIAKSE